MENNAFDYIVVGSGAGGGPVACRLARAGYSVLLLEAGGNTDNYHYQVPVFHPMAAEDQAMSWQYFVRHYSDSAQQQLDSKYVRERDGVFYPRSGTLGGCTAHNALITVYPFNSDWDDIAALTGDPSWASDKMRTYFQRLERCTYLSLFRRLLDSLLSLLKLERPNPSRHGFRGWLTTQGVDPALLLEDPELLQTVISAVLKVFLEDPESTLREISKELDPNDWRVVTRNRQGLTITPLATRRGHRNGTREYILETLKRFPTRLTLRTNALATRVLLDEANRAIGVEFLEGEHLYAADPAYNKSISPVPVIAKARKEVILAGGAFNSPQLLMLSGIGPAEELKKHRIPVKVDLPGVGRNLQDRYEICVISEFKEEFALLKGLTFEPPDGKPPDRGFKEWLKGKGVYATNGALIGIIKRSTSGKKEPDLFIFGLPGRFKGFFPGFSKETERDKNIFSWAILKARTINDGGVVTLRSADPREVPDINFHYFKEGTDQQGEDLEAVVNGVEFVRKLNAAIPDLIKQEVLPGRAVSNRDQVAKFVRDEAWGHHASCTNKIGADNDPLAVLDSEFRVRGTQGLRVVDASVFPKIPGFFIVSAVYMISEKAADSILAEAAAGRSTAGRQHRANTFPIHRADDRRKAAMKTLRVIGVVALLLLLLVVGLVVARRLGRPQSGKVRDEALRAGRTADSFPAAADSYFHQMDGGIALSKDQEKGRNTWLIWTGGNDRFWDVISKVSVGNLDLLKTVSSHPSLKNRRSNRWRYLGVINEPCFEEATGPDPKRFGLWLDRRRADCPADPFEKEQNYPGVKIGARGKNIPVGSYYGYASGVVGLRLFPNPDFDEKAAKRWDANRYYTDPKYYNSKDLVKPYRVGMSCGFCHVGPSPVNPPADPENPEWENLSSTVGAQYMWFDRIFAFDPDPSSFVWQLFHTYRPGTLDTSLVSTDNIDNPRTMNAVYYVGPRLKQAKRWGKETLSGPELNNKQFNDFTSDPALTQFFESPTSWSMRVLKDGSDSVGTLGALNRVYLNIGVFSEEWLLHFNALVGGKPTTPIKIADASKNSAYWQATEKQTFDMARFLVESSAPDHLQEAPGGKDYLTKDNAVLTRGKIVFAERCARCHSSKTPEPPVPGLDPGGCSGTDYNNCWKNYWAWTKTDEFKQKMREMVLKPDFLVDNFLSTDVRVPVTLLQTNACSPLATNAIAENIWDNFSSQSYKSLPSVGEITVYNPITGEPRQYKMPAGGRGYTRPASLVSLWSTAPFLLNNAVGDLDPPAKAYSSGPYNQGNYAYSMPSYWYSAPNYWYSPQPSVENRMHSFQDSIEKMLWPEKREKDPKLGGKIPGPSLIDRTTERSFLRVPGGFLPDELQGFVGVGSRWFPFLFGDGGIEIGPIPKGTPVGLLANVDLEKLLQDPAARQLFVTGLGDLIKLPKGASDDEASKILGNLAEPLLKYSKCPDFVVNRGHYFGTSYLKEGAEFSAEPGLSDADKRALIEFLKTF